MKLPSKSSVLTFAGGVLAALITRSFAKSKTAHDLAVRGVAGGMRMKNDAIKTIESIREQAQDTYEEARRKAEAAETAETAE